MAKLKKKENDEEKEQFQTLEAVKRALEIAKEVLGGGDDLALEVFDRMPFADVGEPDPDEEQTFIESLNLAQGAAVEIFGDGVTPAIVLGVYDRVYAPVDDDEDDE